MTTAADILRRARELLGPTISTDMAIQIACREATARAIAAGNDAEHIFYAHYGIDGDLDRAIAAAEKET